MSRSSSGSFEMWAIFWLTIIGFFIGGFYGMYDASAFHPACWYGALIGFGIAVGAPICIHILD